ncbi:Oligopeptide transport ATP-binding protein OppD [Streptomyces sp. RB5]|uniref:Oligopeptide transport ATP-binding protein OppD n=1 Tax=Streptomyces smaragdinus TaxID=2585196 RepID=A0A7K0CS54_9ACTN|nr:ABC transporter ATP-binding protein [Streptomyces smaragdinus]MQY15832.1 Oligopeptide transport ATP-binding protein OppD [Streptomyces smaragdinus]
MTETALLSVRDLRVAYRTGGGRMVEAVRGVDFDLYPEQTLALVGESGSGKSTLGLGLLRLLPRTGHITGGEVVYRGSDPEGTDVLRMEGSRLRRWRWSEVAMVFQGAMNAFNPVLKVGDQFADTMRAHLPRQRLGKAQVRERSAESLRAVRLEPGQVLDSYPHELSGGMRQRALIALALILEPRVLVLDEPTTALDLLTQRAIVDMLQELRAERGFSMIFISHDLALASELADRVATMYAGRIIESGTTPDLFRAPRHPYTVGLIRAVPPVRAGAVEPVSIPGAPPNLAQLPPGCSFAPRCGHATDACEATDPALRTVEARPAGQPSHEAACLHWESVRLDTAPAAAQDGTPNDAPAKEVAQ